METYNIHKINKADCHKSRAPSLQQRRDGQTDRQTNRAAYRVACTRLKRDFLLHANLSLIFFSFFFSLLFSFFSLFPFFKDYSKVIFFYTQTFLFSSFFPLLFSLSFFLSPSFFPLISFSFLFTLFVSPKCLKPSASAAPSGAASA